MTPEKDRIVSLDDPRLGGLVGALKAAGRGFPVEVYGSTQVLTSEGLVRDGVDSEGRHAQEIPLEDITIRPEHLPSALRIIDETKK